MCRKIKKKKHKKSRKEGEGKEEEGSCAKELTKVVINLRGISKESQLVPALAARCLS
jgi:hypothetical protein